MVLAAWFIAGGCGPQRSYVTEERLEAGLVVSLDGVGGYNWGPQWLRSGLDEAGVKGAIVIYDWSKGPKGMFVSDLVDEARNRAAAKDLATMIETYVAAMPNRPVTLIGHSGGTAVVVWALEDLPEACKVERVVLMAPALAPDYDLSRALRAVRRRLYVMYSYADVGLMAAGTAVFGTMDRQHSVSAGLTGFRLPADLTLAQKVEYMKVRQIPWTINLVKSGHLGGHMGWTTTRFAREFIAPILTGKTDPGEPMVVAGTPAAGTPLPSVPPATPVPPPQPAGGSPAPAGANTGGAG
jgi:pimeloyl-ACP methyl ester carboxylesterase